MKIALLTLVLALTTAAAAAANKPNLMITTGGIDGVYYYYYGTSVAEILAKNATVGATAMQTAASLDNMLLIQRRTDVKKNVFYLGTVLPDSA